MREQVIVDEIHYPHRHVQNACSSDPTGIRSFTLSLRGTTVELTNLGASISKFLIPSGVDGNAIDIVLGYKSPQIQHQSQNPVYFSAVVGRVANRIANGKLQLGQKTINLECNNPPNHLHGGSGGFSHCIWNSNVLDRGDGQPVVQFSYLSKDGDQGYPGAVRVTATYTLRPAMNCLSSVSLSLQLCAELVESGPPTPVNLSQHTYFNLGGQELASKSAGGILDHSLQIEANYYCPVDETSVPTRQVLSVENDWVMDWRKKRDLRTGLAEFGMVKALRSPGEVKTDLEDRKPLVSPYGFDHNYVVRSQPGTSLAKVATLSYGERLLTVRSCAPGVQVYTANYLGDTEDDSLCKTSYGPWSGICLETQHFPDSVQVDPKTHPEFAAGKCFILSAEQPIYEHLVEYTVLSCHSHAELEEDDPPVGLDTDGREFNSIEDMWDSQDLTTWYSRGKDWYEENCSTSVDGVLGGIGWISHADIKGSMDFVKRIHLPEPLNGNSTVACECGAGIGRVSKDLLLHVCDRSDLVESSSRLLYAAPDFIGSQASPCRFYHAELQDWNPAPSKYTLVWIQWVLCYLTDRDIVSFLKRCAASLVDGGVIVLKENTCNNEMFVMDVNDASVTRSLAYWKDLIFKAGLICTMEVWQDSFPDDIYPVPMLALKPAVESKWGDAV